MFGLIDQAQELAVERKQEVQAGRVFLRFQQQEQGIPVMAGELIVQLDANQAVISVNGEILPSPRITPLPAIEAGAAQASAIAAVAKTYDVGPGQPVSHHAPTVDL